MKDNTEVDSSQKQPLSPEQKQKQKKMLVFPLLFLVFGLCLWLIFAPSKLEKAEQQKGFNTSIPLPQNKVLVGDKKEAYEQAKLEDKKQEQMHSLQDLASMFSSGTKTSESSDSKSVSPSGSGSLLGIGGSKQPIATIKNSNNAYREMNRNLGSFFDTPKDDPEKARLNQQVEELRAKLQENESRKSTVSEQMELMEKSYQMAAKYIPQSQSTGTLPVLGGQSVKTVVQPESVIANTTTEENKKVHITAVHQILENPVSALPQSTNDSIRKRYRSMVRNNEFTTAAGSTSKENKNTIKACIYESCTLINGQSVRLRLLESIHAGTGLIPRNSVICGEAKIQGDRLNILIKSLEYQGILVPVELTVYDTDGQKGINIPGSMEVTAIKELAANIGSGMGTSISLTQSAGQQIASDVGKGVIQSGSQYLSKKFQQVKVKLKAGYTVLLVSCQE